MRAFVSLAVAGSLLAVASCAPAIPDSAAGVGLDGDPFATAPAAGSTITGAPLAAPAQISSEPLAAPSAATATGAETASASGGRYAASSSASSADIARETAAALSAAGANSGETPLQAGPSNPAPQLTGARSISDENDFDAVAARQSIESDAARLERQRAQYKMVQPEAVPQRDGETGPNIVQFALSTTNPKGVRLYSRTGFNLKARNARNCASFASADQAQEAFLASGGPKRDRKALDPDGDGFACGWDPAPYRRAVQSAANG